MNGAPRSDASCSDPSKRFTKALTHQVPPPWRSTTTSLLAINGAIEPARRSVCEPSSLPGNTPSRSKELGESIQELRRSSSAARALAVKMTRSRRSEEHTSELQSPDHIVCRLLLEKTKA